MVIKQQCQKPANQPTLEAVSFTTRFCSDPIHQYNFFYWQVFDTKVKQLTKQPEPPY